MLDENSNKTIWVGIAMGLVAILGISSMILFPSAMEQAKATVTHTAMQFVDPDQGFGKLNPKTYDYHYNDDGTAWLIDYHQDSKTVIVPSSVRYDGKNYTITRIDNGALQGKGINSLEIPNSVTSIGNSALMSNNLTSISLPDKMTTLDDNAFANNQISSVKFDDALTSIGNWAFINNQLPGVTFNAGLKTIGAGAFQRNKFNTVALPDSLERIGDWAFASNSDGSGIYVKTITKSPQLVSPNGGNYNAHAFNEDVVWSNK